MKCNLKPVIIVLIIVIIIALSFINYEFFTSSSAGSSVELEPTTTSSQECDVIKTVETPYHLNNTVIPDPNHLNAINYSGYRHIPIGNNIEWSTSF